MITLVRNASHGNKRIMFDQCLMATSLRCVSHGFGKKESVRINI